MLNSQQAFTCINEYPFPDVLVSPELNVLITILLV